METACRLCSAYDAVVLLREGDQLRIVAHHGPIPITFASQQISRGWASGRAVIERRTIHIAEHADEYPVAAALASRGVAAGSGKMLWRANVVVPLMREGEAIGVIGLRRTEPVPFSEGQIELLKTFSDQAVIAIENARLFDELQAKTRDLTEALEHQTATSEVLSAISRSPTEVQPVFDAIARGATELCGATSGGVDRFDGEFIHLASHYNWSPEALRAMGEIYPATPSRGFASARSILTRSVVHIPDISKDPEYTATPVIEVGFRSVLAVPMLRDRQPIGSIALVRLEPRPFTDRQITLLQTFAEQAVIAVNNVRLFDEVQAKTRDLEESLRQQTATADVLKVISRSAFDLRAVFDALISSAVNLIRAAHGTIYVRDGENFPIRAHFGVSERFVDFLVQNPPAPGMGSASGRVMLTGKVVVIPDILEDKDYAHPANELNRTRSILAVPLLRNDRVEGVLVIAQKEPGTFSSRQIELVQTFADQAVIAIENARLFDEVQARTRDLTEALQQQTATADVLKVISRSAFDLDMVLKTLADSARSLSGATGVLVLLRDGEFARLRAESGCTPQHREYVAAHPFRPGRETVTGRVLITGEAAHIPDVLADPDYEYGIGPQVGSYRATFGTPLIRNGIVDGVFTLLRPEPGAFTPRQIELVRTFADQAVIAIENTRLFDEVQAKTRDLQESLEQQTATADVLKVISRSAFDLQAVFDTLISSAIALIGADQGSLWMRDGDLFRFRAYHGHSPDYVAWVDDHPLRAGRSSSVGRVAMTKQVASIPDVREDLEYTPPANAMMGVRSVLAAPLLRHAEVEGVFVIFRKVPGDFSQRQIELVQTFADQAMIAIENSRLFDEVQAKTRDLEESLAQQTATADVLKVISRSAFDLQTVLRTLVRSASELSGSTHGTIWLKDGDVFRFGASYGNTPEFDDYLTRNPQRPGHSSVGARVFLFGTVQNIADVQADAEYDPSIASRMGVCAAVGVPLLRDHEVVGALALGRPRPGLYSDREIELVQTFADQAVIAIENARMFEEVQASTRDLTEALQQQTATANVLKVISRSAFDLQAVLTTLAESARDLCGASFVTLSLREGDTMRLIAESGCTPEIVQFMGAHPIRAGRETFTGRVMLSGEAVHLPDVLADPEYDFGEGPRIGNYRALLAVPLLREGRVEGVVRQVLGLFALPDPVPFTERQIEMVRAFADQAVIAIENARLFNEVQSRTKELAASLDDLRKAQDRLIQSEKLASLGQLTAGIAHEIKNPLNFINNYSALSRELVDELAEAIKGAAGNEATHGEADELIGAIGGNLDKIVQHGKRADSIVKNMLLHSREGSGERAATNVNAMVEEALNLAYHGARAEKPGFNVTIAKSLDPNAGAAEVYAQEMSRVLLNLISNGFYATTKRKQSAGDGAYEPTISASTRDLGPKVEIAIRDNGTGISDEVKAKIFNPFFTTKPAGEGTGLGLSLSHDIVVKQHGGTIEVLTAPDVFTQFTIVLPRGATGA